MHSGVSNVGFINSVYGLNKGHIGPLEEARCNAEEAKD